MQEGPTAQTILNATTAFRDRHNLVKEGKENMVQLLSKANMKMQFITTGIPVVDAILGGGIPVGITMQVYGKPSCGKSSFALHLAGEYSKSTPVVYIDVESRFTKERAEQFNVNPSNFILIRPETGEQAVDAIKLYADARVKLIIVDSVPAMVPQKQLDVDEKNTPNKQAGVALVASLLGKHIWSIGNKCANNGVTTLFINQIRDNIGAFGFGNQFYIPGGWTLQYQVSQSILVGVKGPLKVSDDHLGDRLAFIVKKNSVSKPFEIGEVNLIFDQGFRPIETEKQDLKAARKRSIESRKLLYEVLGVGKQIEYVIDETTGEVLNSVEPGSTSAA
jgi:recombination protein RecA